MERGIAYDFKCDCSGIAATALLTFRLGFRYPKPLCAGNQA
jgi:hypothetical protein